MLYMYIFTLGISSFQFISRSRYKGISFIQQLNYIIQPVYKTPQFKNLCKIRSRYIQTLIVHVNSYTIPGTSLSTPLLMVRMF